MFLDGDVTAGVYNKNFLFFSFYLKSIRSLGSQKYVFGLRNPVESFGNRCSEANESL